MTTHPNQQLHDLLVSAARKGTLNAQYIQEVTKSQVPPSVERDASAYVNWNTTLTLLSRAPAKVWFAGVSKQGRCSNGRLNTLWNLILPTTADRRAASESQADAALKQRIVTNLP